MSMRYTRNMVHLHFGTQCSLLTRIPGPVVRLSPTEVAFSDLSATQEIFRIGGNFNKSRWYQLLTQKGVKNLFNTNDPKFHTQRRRLLAGPISDTALRPMEPVIKQKAEYAIRRMRGNTERDGVVDVYKWWVCMAGDIVGELSFGRPFGLLDDKVNPHILFRTITCSV